MGIISRIISFTPFRKQYEEYQKKRRQQWIAAEEKRTLPRKTAFYKQFIKEGDLVFDIGANVGNRIDAFLNCGAKVVAVEPQSNCVAELKNRFGSNITIEQTGLSNEPGELDMHLSTDSTISSFSNDFIDKTRSRFKHSQWNQTIKVPVVTLDSLIGKHGTPQFCKIDVEGFELNVLKGLTRTVPFLSFEYCVPEMSENMLSCIKRLHEIDPAGLFNYSVEETMQLALTEWMGYDAFVSLVTRQEFSNTLFGDIYFKSNQNA